MFFEQELSSNNNFDYSTKYKPIILLESVSKNSGRLPSGWTNEFVCNDAFVLAVL
jgi:hypothetical protein